VTHTFGYGSPRPCCAAGEAFASVAARFVPTRGLSAAATSRASN
jgi:hypothetical protein